MEKMIFDPEQLRKYRLLARKSCAGAAEAIGCAKDVYEDWERGKQTPDEYWIKRAAKALKCYPEELAKGWEA